MTTDLFRDEEFEDESTSENIDDLVVSEGDFHSIVVGPADWTIDSLRKQIGKQIDLNPEFQRRGVWSKTAKSSFIESLFLNIPIPQILLASQKANKNKFIVLDGKQRLLAISEFFAGQFDDGQSFTLRDMRILKQLEGKCWPEIEGMDDWPETIKNHTQRTAVLRGWEKEATLYEIFHRLNSGSVKLSPMELRMSLYPGKFMKYAIEKTETVSAIHQLLRLKKPDKRMTDVELLIRFLAFGDKDIPYEGYLKQFLDNACVKYNEALAKNGNDTSDLDARYTNFNLAIECAIKEFDSDVCRKFKNGQFERRFNRAVFDIQIGGFSDPALQDLALQKPGAIKDAFAELSAADGEFVNALETTTKSVPATRNRFASWYGEIERRFDISLTMPRIKNA